jgi:hypothetical protein
MKYSVLSAATLLASAALLAADPKDDVKAAAQKLAAADNYSWTTTVESSQFRPGPSHGQTVKGGFTHVDFSMRDNTIEAYVKDGKGAIKTEDGWKSLDDAAKDSGDGQNPARFLVMRLRNFKSPAAQAEEIVGQTKDLSKSEEAYAGDLTEEGAKNLLSFGGRRGGQGPAVSNAKGSVKFWVKDGAITKTQYKVSGTINRNGDDVDIDRTTTTEIKNVGATTVTVPDEAKSKIN